MCDCRILLSLVGIISSVIGQNLRGIENGFPARWDGDRERGSLCEKPIGKRGFPAFLDGVFLSQLSASYGHDFDPPGQKLTHMIDAIGGVAAYHLNGGQNVTFSGAYYPSIPYKIWDFYGRDLRKSTVAWKPIFSAWNQTSEGLWSAIPRDPDVASIHPNINFWKIGRSIVGVTESATWTGMEFRLPSLTHFQKFPFVETSEIFRDPEISIIKPLGMPTLERMDADGNIWATCSAISPQDRKFFQIVFTISPAGVRIVRGIHDFGRFDLGQCDGEGRFTGDKRTLPAYGYSITATENFVIIPVTSVLINPCAMFRDDQGRPTRDADIVEPKVQFDLDPEVPLRFLIFDKQKRRFATPQPLETFPAMFISTQFNAYETKEGFLIADMIAYDSFDLYTKYLHTSYLKRQIFPSVSRLLRFTLDLGYGRAKYNSLLPQNEMSAEFAQINHQMDGKEYQYGYVLLYPFAAGSQIMKLDMNEPSGKRNKFFAPGSNFALSEPWFVPTPSGYTEDDGILLVRALDTAKNRGVLFAVDARSMVEISRVIAPISVPFGFHNKYFSREELGLVSSGDGRIGGRVVPLLPPNRVYPTPLSWTNPTYRTRGTTTRRPRPYTMRPYSPRRPYTRIPYTRRPYTRAPYTRRTFPTRAPYTRQQYLTRLPYTLRPTTTTTVPTTERSTTESAPMPTYTMRPRTRRPFRFSTPTPRITWFPRRTTTTDYGIRGTPSPKKGICSWMKEIFDQMGSDFCREFDGIDI